MIQLSNKLNAKWTIGSALKAEKKRYGYQVIFSCHYHGFIISFIPMPN